MADGKHVAMEVTSETNSIFQVFTKLLNSTNGAEKHCVSMCDVLKSDNCSVGTNSALSYTSKRLVRSLASSQSKRQAVSFSALTAALQNNMLSVEEVWSALEAEIKNSATKSEHGSSLIMATLTCGAIVISGCFESVSSGAKVDIIQKLVSCGGQKQYLRNAICAFFVELLKKVDNKFFKSVVWPIVEKEVEQRHNLEDEWYAVLFLCCWSFPKCGEKYICKKFQSKRKFCELVIVRCPYFPSIVQEAIMERLVAFLSKQSGEMVGLWEFFLKFEHTLTPKWILFMVAFCKKMLDLIDNPSFCLDVMRPEFLNLILMPANKAIIRECGFKDTCKTMLNVMVARVIAPEVDKSLSLQVLKHLLFNGDLNFDQKTKTKTIQTLIRNLDASCVKSFVTEVKDIVAVSSLKSDESEWSFKEQSTLLSMLSKLIVHPNLQNDSDVVVSTIKIMFDNGFLKSEKTTKVRKQAYSSVFFKAVELRNFKMDSAVLLLNEIVDYVNKNLPHLNNPLSETTLTEWKKVIATNITLKKGIQDKKTISVRLLLLHMGILLFRDAELASNTVEDLLQCYNRIVKNKKETHVVGSEEPHWVEVIVDLLLALLSRENKLLRHVVNCVFPSVAPELTPTALQQIVDALDPGSRNDVLGHIDSDVSEDEDEEEEEDDGDDLDDTDSGLEDDETELETVNDKLRMAVRNALGYSAALTDDESVDMDDMNEDEERRLNESLANAFRMFRASKSSKKKQTKDEEARTHFRVRVLDLVEIIATYNPTLGTCLDLMPPLLSLLEFAIRESHQKHLQNRLETVFKKISNIKKFQNSEHIKLETVVDVFKGLFERDVSGLVYAEMFPTIVVCSGFLVKASQIFSSSSHDVSLENIFVNLLNRFFKSNDRKVPFGIFQGSLRLLWEGNWAIGKHIMSLLVDKDLKVFKKLKLLDLLETFYRNERLQSTATDDRKTALCTAESKFVQKLSKRLGNPDVEKTKLHSAFHSRLFKIVQLAVGSLHKYRKGCPPTPEWGLIVNRLFQYADLFQLQNMKQKLSNLARVYDIPISTVVKRKKEKKVLEASSRKDCEEEISFKAVSNLKRKASIGVSFSEGEGDIQLERPVKKKKASKQARLLARESRELREAVSSKGIQDISFNSAALDALNNDGENDYLASNDQILQKNRKKKLRH